MENSIEIERVFKQFPRTSGYRDIITFWRRRQITALDGVDLSVPRGSVFGLLGPNGAGKTTLLKILAGLVHADAGVVRVNGVDVARHPRQAREHLMYVSVEERSLYWRLTATQNLRFYAPLYEIPAKQIRRRVGDILALVGLDDVADERVVKYSTGMKQRLAIARGLLSDPDILLLDEPTRSLDPMSARALWKFIKEELVGQHGKTVVIATHNMEEASQLCLRVAILHRGRVSACDTVAAVSDRLAGTGRCTITLAHEDPTIVPRLSHLAGIQTVSPLPTNGHQDFSLEVVVEDPSVHIPMVVEHLVNTGSKVVQVTPARVSLSDAIAALGEGTQP